MPTPVRFSYSVRDSQGVEASECLYGTATDAALATDLAAEWSTMAGLLDAIIGGKIIRGEVCIPVKMTGGKGSPDADSRIEEVGVFNFSDAVSVRRNGVPVISISDAVMVSGLPSRIDLANAAVAAWFAALTATGGIIRFTNAHQQALTALVDALLSFRKHRAALERVSFEPAP